MTIIATSEADFTGDLAAGRGSGRLGVSEVLAAFVTSLATVYGNHDDRVPPRERAVKREVEVSEHQRFFISTKQ